MSGTPGEHAAYLGQLITDVPQLVCDNEQGVQLCFGEILLVSGGARLSPS
jgi:hypothetical protein